MRQGTVTSSRVQALDSAFIKITLYDVRGKYFLSLEIPREEYGDFILGLAVNCTYEIKEEK